MKKTVARRAILGFSALVGLSAQVMALKHFVRVKMRSLILSIYSPDGTTIHAEGLCWRRQTGSTAIADMPGFVPGDPGDPERAVAAVRSQLERHGGVGAPGGVCSSARAPWSVWP